MKSFINIISQLFPILQMRKLRLTDIEEPDYGMAMRPENGKDGIQIHIW